MKKLVCVAILVALFSFGCFCAKAVSKEQFDVSVNSNENSKKFELVLSMDSEKTACGGTITVEYESEFLELIKASSDLYMLETRNKDNGIEVVFVSGYEGDSDIVLSFESLKNKVHEIKVSSSIYCGTEVKSLKPQTVKVQIENRASNGDKKAGETDADDLSYDQKDIEGTSSVDLITLEESSNTIFDYMWIVIAAAGICVVVFCAIMLALKSDDKSDE